MTYTYWEGENGWMLGYLNDYPEQWTQGKDIPELEEMLIDLYENFQEAAKQKKEQVKKNRRIAHSCMKRNLLLKEISKREAVFVLHGKKHDIYKNTKTGAIEQIPRHSDIEENLARNIIKHFSYLVNLAGKVNNHRQRRWVFKFY